MSNSNPGANTNTNSQRVCIVKNSAGDYLIHSEGACLVAGSCIASDLGRAMAAAYALIAGVSN